MQVLLQQLDLADVVGEQLADDVVRLLAQLAQQLVASAKPRAISSGAGPPPSASVATTISTPSSDSVGGHAAPRPRCRRPRARRRTSCRPRRDRRSGRRSTESSTTSPFSAITIELAGTPASCASFACAACIRYSPWIGIIAFGRIRESSVRNSSARACPETCTSAFSSCSTSAPFLVNPVDRIVHAQLVAGNGTRRDDHRVAALDLDRLGGRCRR